MIEDPQRDAIIDALLPEVPFDGWTRKSLRQALISIGEHPDDAVLYFPDGAGEMIEAFSALADARMEAEAATAGLAAFRMPARIRTIIAIRLEQNRGNKEAIRRALSWLAIPINAPRAMRITAATIDTIWYAAGDKASDFSWYSKRAILAGVYSATLLYWLHNSSEDDDATLAFLDRRLANVAGIGGFRKKIEGRVKGLKDRLPGFVRRPQAG